jgi:spore coat protein CotH
VSTRASVASVAAGVWLVAACAESPTAPSPSPPPERSAIFDPTVLHRVDVTMDPADWQALRDDFLSNRYYPADVTLDGEHVSQVGVRSRGGATRSGTKPSLHVKFHEYARAQRFHGLESLAIKNVLPDPTLLREYLAMAAYEAMGVPAPAVSFARLSVNGDYWGLYSIVEAVEDEHFLALRFGESHGQLYQYEYPGPWDFSPRGEDAGAYVPYPFKPETHAEDPDTTGLLALIRAINSGSDETFTRDLAAFLDLELFLMFMAVENAVAEGDGLVGFVGMNNFYLYEYAGRQRFAFVAWDRNASFNAPAWPILHRMEQNVLTRRLLADPEALSLYLDALRRTVDEFVNEDVLGPRLEAAYRLIREAVLEDSNRIHGNDEFEAEIERLRTFVAWRRDEVLSQIAGLGH